MILVDTSALLDFFRGADSVVHERFREVLQRGVPFGITPLIMQEVLQGAKTEKDFHTLHRYLAGQRFYLPDDPRDAAVKAAKIYFTLRKQGITVSGSNDCLIAQIAIEHGLFLLHGDSDFDRIASTFPLKIFRGLAAD